MVQPEDDFHTKGTGIFSVHVQAYLHSKKTKFPTDVSWKCGKHLSLCAACCWFITQPCNKSDGKYYAM